MGLDTYIEAEYESGFVLREDEQDHSPYDPGKNIFHAILNGRPCEFHGKMIRFTLVTSEHTYDIDWTALPDNARPIRFKKMERESVGGVWQEPRIVGIDFGYQYTDEHGKNVQEVINL